MGAPPEAIDLCVAAASAAAGATRRAPNAEKNESVCESSGLVLAESRRGRRGARVEDFAAGFGD
jgi:hypothetical protein